MAVTAIPTSLVQKLWSKELWQEAQNEIFWKRFIGTDEPTNSLSDASNSIIVKKTDLKKEKGDTITLGLQMKLKGTGVDGDSTLEGNEEAITSYPFSVSVNQKRHGCRLKGKMEEQKAAFNLRSTAKSNLKGWLTEYIDSLFFQKLCASPTAGRTLYAGSATSIATVTATDIMTTSLLGAAKRKAKMCSPRFRKVRHDGKEYYVVVLHPYAFRDLKKDAAITDALQNAWWRGDKNPIFSGAELVYDGMIIYEHELVTLTTDGAESANVAHNILLGAHAGCWGVAKEAFWEEDDFDYHNQQGFATGIIHGFEKTKFGATGSEEDFATLSIITGAKDD